MIVKNNFLDMEEQNWYNHFLESIYDLFPKKAQVTQELMDLLCLEREAVYRRTRKDVIFLAHEVVKIASTWNISLDEILGIHSKKISFQMQPLNYLNPSKSEFHNMQRMVNNLDEMVCDPESEYMEVRNRLPRPLSIGYLALYRFKIFIWAYQYNQNEAHKHFSDIIIPEKMCQEFASYKKKICRINNSHYILDQYIFEYFVNSIKYFHSIMLVTDEEKELLKKELHALLDYMLEIANKGYYPETQKKVSLYVSKINIDTNYSYLFSEKQKMCHIHAFGKYYISSFDLDMVNNFRTWMNLKKRSSIRISEVNEIKRIEFFSEQRRVIDGL